MNRWELNDGRAAVGPLDEEHVLRMIAAGLPEATVVRAEGAGEWRSIRSHAPFALALAGRAPQPVTDPAAPVGAAPASYRWALFAGLGVAVGAVLVGLIVYAGITSKPPPTTYGVAPEPPRASPVAVAPPPRVKTAPERVAEAKTMEAALAGAKPLMDDVPNQVSAGTVLFAGWAIGHLAWKDVAVVRDETTAGLARKDIDAQRGKRLCVGGAIIQIAVSKGDAGKSFVGLLTSSDDGNLYHFIAVRSTGTLEENSYARLCGVVTELYDYQNSAGGTGHAITVVGMFDLPENRK